MATTKVQLSLRLRHDSEALADITGQLGLESKAGWDIGDDRRTPVGRPLGGTRDQSYRIFPLPVTATKDINKALLESAKILKPFSDDLASFSNSGGLASLALAWFVDSSADGDRIAAEVIQELARLHIALDLYVYLSPGGSASTA
jgi:hypothetical protein